LKISHLKEYGLKIGLPLFSWGQKGRRKPKKGIGKDRCPAFD
jgi:hypothetical protein